jgi:hypothetical protein
MSNFVTDPTIPVRIQAALFQSPDVKQALYDLRDYVLALTPGGGGGTIIVQDEGVTLSSAVTTLDFVGGEVTATGASTVTVTIPTVTTITGNAGTATALQTARNIAGVAFDGTADISITTATIADSLNKRYVTDANLVTIGNQSGTNTGDQQLVVGAFGSSPTANGATVTGTMTWVGQPADATHPGLIALGTQTLGSGTKTVDAMVVTGDLTVDTTSFFVDSSTNRVGIGTTNPGGGYTGAGDMSLHTLKSGHNFVFIETLTAASDPGVVMSSLTSNSDFAVFLDESDSQHVKFAVGNLDTDANRQTATKLWLTQDGYFGAGVLPDRPFAVKGSTSGGTVLSLAYLQNTNNVGASTLAFFDDTGSFKGRVGWTNSGATYASKTVLQSSGVLSLYTGVDASPIEAATFTAAGLGTFSQKTSIGHSVAPLYQLDLGTTVADVMIALYADATNPAGYGVRSGDLRSFVDFNTTRWSWGVGKAFATPVMTLSGLGILNTASANGMTMNGVTVLSQTNTVTGITNKTFTTPTINGATTTGTIAMGTSTISGTPNFSGAATIGSVAFLSQTNTVAGITNKTFTSPVINTGTFGTSFSSTTANVAASGNIRLARADTQAWRNNGNSADLPLGVSASDRLQFN